nr:DUF1593 domain-containing protein [Cytophagales bacterium]
AISDQDDAGPWLRREFPELFYIASPSTPDWKEYWRATWTGISGDRHYKNGPKHKFELVDNPWLEANVMKNHGPLGALYPKLAFIMEGDTPSFLGLETRPIWTNTQDSRDCVTADNGQTECTDPATIWRWREHFQHDFAARMDWCVATTFAQANHNPVAVLNGDKTKNVVEIPARSGSQIELSAQGSSDPDSNNIKVSWFVYPEAGTHTGTVQLSATTGNSTKLTIPDAKEKATIHVIMQLEDDGTPRLFTYRRCVVTIQP